MPEWRELPKTDAPEPLPARGRLDLSVLAEILGNQEIAVIQHASYERQLLELVERLRTRIAELEVLLDAREGAS